MKDRIVPVGLKGKEITDRMIELMGVTSVNENTKNSAVELTKKGPDGKVYGIVRENHEYYIKTSNKTKDLQVEDFHYIGGLQNKKSEAYSSYAKAIKHLNGKFKSLNEAYGVSGNINVFESDRLLREDIASFYQQTESGFANGGNMMGSEMSECCGAPVMEGMCSECGAPSMHGVENEGMDNGENQRTHFDSPSDWGGRNDDDMDLGYNRNMSRMYDDPVGSSDLHGTPEMDSYPDDELDGTHQAVEDMMGGPKVPNRRDRHMYENKLSIARSIEQMDNIIESVVGNKKKIYTIK